MLDELELTRRSGNSLSASRLIACVMAVVPMLTDLSETDLNIIVNENSLALICLPILSRMSGQNSDRFRALLFEALTSIMRLSRLQILPAADAGVHSILRSLDELPGSLFSRTVDTPVGRLNEQLFRRAEAIIAAERLQKLPVDPAGLKEWVIRFRDVNLKLGTSTSPALTRCLCAKLDNFPEGMTLLPTHQDHPDYIPFKSDRLLRLYLDTLFTESGIIAPVACSEDDIRRANSILTRYQYDMSQLLLSLNDENFWKSISEGTLLILKKCLSMHANGYRDSGLLLKVIDRLDVLTSHSSL